MGHEFVFVVSKATIAAVVLLVVVVVNIVHEAVVAEVEVEVEVEVEHEDDDDDDDAANADGGVWGCVAVEEIVVVVVLLRIADISPFICCHCCNSNSFCKCCWALSRC